MNAHVMSRPEPRVLAGWLVLVFWAAPLLAAPAGPAASDSLSKLPKWQAPAAQEVKSRVMAWLESKKPDEATRTKVLAAWADAPADAPETEVFVRLMASFAVADKEAAGLVKRCSEPRKELVLPSLPWLTDPKTPPLVANNLRLLYGRWLVQQRLFDEAKQQFAGLQPGDVVAPATLLFYQAAVFHRLLSREDGLNAIQQLLDGPATSPKRYLAVARLMQEDLKRLQDDSLDHIARRMDDIQRRLDLGHAGPRTREVEDGVIKSLDKLIKKIQDQQQASAASSSNSIQSSQPAPDSRPLGGKGPGEVTRRNVGSQSGWGDLPPKEREQALQQIGRDFPSHYRDIIEQYFRRLATEEKP